MNPFSAEAALPASTGRCSGLWEKMKIIVKITLRGDYINYKYVNQKRGSTAHMA